MKKAYSILSQVYAEAIFDNDINSSNEFLSMNNKFGLNLYSVIKQYFDLGVNCESTNCLNLNTMNSMKLYKKYNNSSIGYHSWFDDCQFILKDGMFVMIQQEPAIDGQFIFVDVNGYKKGPNRMGFDLFTFEVTKDNKLLPMGADGTKADTLCSNILTANVACTTNNALYDEHYWKNLK